MLQNLSTKLQIFIFKGNLYIQNIFTIKKKKLKFLKKISNLLIKKKKVLIFPQKNSNFFLNLKRKIQVNG